jgi:CMP-N-acetylneuraminic acid synthetase
MKIVTMIPYWHEYRFPEQSVSNRDTLKIGGYSLIERAVDLVQNIEQVNEVIVYSSDEQVKKFLDSSLKYKFLKREVRLDDENISIEDIIESFLKKSDADVIVLMHPKCPFLKPKSLEDCINKVISGSFDSAFIGSKHQKLAWFKGEPLNYSLVSGDNTQSLSSLEPVIFESSSVYVFTRELFEKTRRRIGINPYMKFIGHFEGFEIDRSEDYEIAELIINAGLDALES